MNVPDDFPNADPRLDALAAALAASQSEAHELRAEIEETNRGVVALYAELDAQAEQLRHATELKSRFLAYMSHEFRTPINSIRSISRLLQDRVDGPLTAEQEKQIGFIQSSAAEFADLVDDLLDLAKIEAGRVEVSSAWFELVDLFQALRGMFKPVVTNAELTLVFEEPVGLPQIYTDNRRLSQILRNFISNALKFTTQGEVRVSAVVRQGGFVTFSVQDTGIGIAPEFHEAIFEDYLQVDSPVQKRLRGTGLGLAVSKQLAALLGGSVSLQSELGRGSTFSVSVPVRVDGAAATAGGEG